MIASSEVIPAVSWRQVDTASLSYGALAVGAAAVVVTGAGLIALRRWRQTSETARPDASQGWVRPASEMEMFWGEMHADGSLHTVCAVALGGSAMEPDTARRAMRCVAARHPVLRSVFEVN
jgi:hypothetical protein